MLGLFEKKKTPEERLEKCLEKKDWDGLARAYCQAIAKPVVIAGSINSFQRVDFVNELNPWAFTMGSALFTENFVPGGGFYNNLEALVGYMNSVR